MVKNKLFENTLKQFDIGYWKLKKESSNDFWSDQFYRNIDLKKVLDNNCYYYFIEEIIHPKDKEAFEKNYTNYKNGDVNFRQKVKLKSTTGEYCNFIAYTSEESPLNIKSKTKLVFFLKISDYENENSPFYDHEIATMSSTGSWYVDFKNKKSYWDAEAKKILGYPQDYEPSLKNSQKYYAEDCHQQASDLFLSCATIGKPFDSEIKMITSKGKEIWVRSVGRPITDDNQKIIGIKGVFQNIDESKKKELKLQKSIDIIASQNNRLFNFAHIVSHNLRSHSSNLTLLVQLIESIDSTEEKLELINEVKTIGENLNTTIEHLNEIVTVHTNKKQKRKDLIFKSVLNLVENSIRNIINSGNAKITYDFRDLKGVRFIPAYLESVFLNLITNAIKYKHPNRDASIHFKSGIEGKRKFLRISDNGVGIDMERYGDKIFGMYKTFHHNTDAVGIGLFITKNQIESQNGTITVDSIVNEGTTFTIWFK